MGLTSSFLPPLTVSHEASQLRAPRGVMVFDDETIPPPAMLAWPKLPWSTIFFGSSVSG